jgi:hypothetical protein
LNGYCSSSCWHDDDVLFQKSLHEKSVENIGACLLACLWWDMDVQIQEDLFEQYHGSAGGRIRIWYGLRQILNASDSLLLRTKAAADKHNTGIHMVIIFHPTE